MSTVLPAALETCHRTAVDPLRWILDQHPMANVTGKGRIDALDLIMGIASKVADQRVVEADWLQRISDHLGVPLKTVRATWKQATESARPVPAGDQAPAAPTGAAGGGDYAAMFKEFVGYVAASDAKPDGMCSWKTASDTPADISDGDVILRFSHGQRMAGRRIIDQEVRQAAQVIFDGYRQDRRAALLSRIVGRPSTDAGRAELRKWMTGATGVCRDLDNAVMRQFIWQVKRLATGQNADWPIIPVLVGDQAVGKSTANERLCAPLAELSFPIDATAITDERKSLVITRGLVGRLDEMAGMAKADQEKLKAMATANHTMFRELYSMSLQQRRRTCSFIARACPIRRGF